MSDFYNNLELYKDLSACEPNLLSLINYNFFKIDSTWQVKIKGIVNTLPLTSELGDVYILDNDPEYSFSIFSGTGWISIPLRNGNLFYNESSEEYEYFDGSSIVPFLKYFKDIHAYSINTDKISSELKEVVVDNGDAEIFGLFNYFGVGSANEEIENFTVFSGLGNEDSFIFVVKNKSGGTIRFKSNGNIEESFYSSLTLLDGESISVFYDSTTETFSLLNGDGGGKGVLTCENLTELGSIPVKHRSEGLIVFVKNSNANYQLRGGVTNSDWHNMDDSGVSGSVPRGTCLAYIGSDEPNGFISCLNTFISKDPVGGNSKNGDDYFQIYEMIWNMGGVFHAPTGPIAMQGGTKGSTALDDWNSGKVIHLNFASSSIFLRASSSAIGTFENYKTARPSTNFTTSSTGAHTHTRGTMNITGRFRGGRTLTGGFVGAFSRYGEIDGNNNTGSAADNSIEFNAADSWTGSTSSAGAHTHSITGGGDSETAPKAMAVNWILKY